MKGDRNVALAHRLGGDSACSLLLQGLGDGRALTAVELATLTGLAPPAVSALLEDLAGAGLVQVVRQGRHRYHRLGAAAAAHRGVMPEASRAMTQHRSIPTGPRDVALRAARTCYGHLAGSLGVAIADALVARRHIELSCEAATVWASGMALFDRIGIDVAPFASSRGRSDPAACRPCLDWSERRPHVGGRVGVALCTHALERDWIRRDHGTRAVTVTPSGRRALEETFGMRLPL